MIICVIKYQLPNHKAQSKCIQHAQPSTVGGTRHVIIGQRTWRLYLEEQMRGHVLTNFHGQPAEKLQRQKLKILWNHWFSWLQYQQRLFKKCDCSLWTAFILRCGILEQNFECIHKTHIKCIKWAYSGSPVLILCIVLVHYCLCFYQWMNDASSELNTAYVSCISVWPLQSALWNKFTHFTSYWTKYLVLISMMKNFTVFGTEHLFHYIHST